MSYEYDEDRSSSADESEDEAPSAAYKNSYVLVGIDCSPSMFNANTPDFQKAIQAVYKSAENLIFDKTCYRRLAVILHHPDADQRLIMEFKNDHFADSLLKLQKLAAKSSEELEVNYGHTDKSFHLGNFLIECKKILSKISKDDKKYIFYMTNNGDPCDGDENIMFQVRQEVSEMEDINYDLQILPTQQNFDYETFYGNIMATHSRHYYNQEHLTIKLDAAIKVKPFDKRIRLYLDPDPTSTISINCLENKYCKNAKLLPNIRLTKDLQTEVFPVAAAALSSASATATYTLPIKNKSGPTGLNVSAAFKESLYDCEVKVGLCVQHASKVRYSTPGVFNKTPSLIKAHAENADVFTAFWTSCKNNNYYILCTYKSKEHGKVHPAELTPVLVDGECYFMLVVLPQVHNISAPDPIKTDDNDDMEMKLDVLLSSLLEATRIENYDITNMLPYKYTKQVHYFLKEMFGAKYKYTGSTAEYLDITHLNALAAKEGSPLYNLMELYPPAESVAAGSTKRKRQPRKK